MEELAEDLAGCRRSAACWDELRAAARAHRAAEGLDAGPSGSEPLIATLGALVGEVQAERGATPFGPEGLLLRAVAILGRLEWALQAIARPTEPVPSGIIPGGAPMAAVLSVELAAVAVRILEEATGSRHAAALALRGTELEGIAAGLRSAGEAAILVGLDLFRDALPSELAREDAGGP